MTAGSGWEEVAPSEVAAWLERHPGSRLVDVREPPELEAYTFPGARNLPLSRLAEWVGDLAPQEPVLFICQSGIRSQRMCSALAAEGFAGLANLTGGMKAWVRDG